MSLRRKILHQPGSSEPLGLPESGEAGNRNSGFLADFFAKYAVILVLVLLVLVFSVWMPSTFATAGNFKVMVNSQTIILVLAVAATIVLRTGEFDLSLGNLMAFSAVLLGVLTAAGVSGPIAALCVIAVGLAVGFVNGFLVVKVGVNSLITTLGMLTILAGLAFALTGGRRADTYPKSLSGIVNTEVFGLPLLTFYGWLLVLALWYVYEKTPIGRRLLFIGGNPDAARLTGVRVDRVKIGAFVAASGLATLAGILISGYLGSVDPGIGSSYLLAPFAAAFLGATTIKPGRYNAFGTLAGLYLLTVGITGLQLLGGAIWVSDVFNGAALILAVSLGQIAGRRNA